MNIIGENTRDLHNLGGQHPAETGLPGHQTERALTRWSHRALIAGILTLAITYGATLASAIIAEHGLYTSRDATVFAVIGFVSLNSLGTCLLFFHAYERTTRQSRTLIRRAMTRAEQNAGIGAANRDAIDNLATLIGENTRIVEAIRQEMNDVKARLADVPSYGKGVIDGVTLRGQVLDDSDR